MKSLKIAYFGTPYFSARFLERLLTDISIKHLIEIKVVVSQPDKPMGRKQILTKSPVKIVAEKYKLKVLDSLRSLEQYYSSSNVEKNVNLGFLYAYGEIIPKELLSTPKFGFWNTHPSLLPKYRGASPIAYPLMLGDKKTGVTLFVVDEKMDHGPIIAQEELQINLTDRRPELEIKLTDLAFEMFKKTIIKLASLRVNELKIHPQNHSQATHARYLTKVDGFIPFSTLKKAINNPSTSLRINQQLTIKETPRIIKEYFKKHNLAMQQFNNLTIYNLFKGLYPWPGLWTIVEIKGQPHFSRLGRDSRGKQKRLKINDIILQNGQLILKKVQLEGKKEVDFATFKKAYGVFIS